MYTIAKPLTRSSALNLSNRIVSSALVVCLLLGSLGAAASESSTVAFKLQMVNHQLDLADKVIRVKKDDQVILTWSTDKTAHIHLHGYDIEQTLNPSSDGLMSFRAYATGRFPISLHSSSNRRSSHHAGPLLYLEVLPR